LPTSPSSDQCSVGVQLSRDHGQAGPWGARSHGIPGAGTKGLETEPWAMGRWGRLFRADKGYWSPQGPGHPKPGITSARFDINHSWRRMQKKSQADNT